MKLSTIKQAIVNLLIPPSEKSRKKQYRYRKKLSDPKVYIVLGSGRSGTSFVSDSLSKNGAEMGQALGDPFTYDCEHPTFRALNDKILKAAGGDYFNPPSRKKILTAGKKFEQEIKQTIQTFEGEKWGFKDPRTALTLEVYLPHIKGDIYFICSFRSLNRTTESLMRAEGLDKKKAKKLTREYNKRILELIANFSI